MSTSLGIFSAPASHLDRAQSFASRLAWPQAEEEARLWLQEHPGSEAAAVLHATAMIRLSQPFDAALELEDFLKKYPDSFAAMKLYAALLVDVIDDRSKAEELLRHCTEVSPGDAEVWEGLGKLSLNRHQDTEAAKYFRKAVELAPEDATFAAELARSLEDANPAESAAIYRAAVERNQTRANAGPVVYAAYASFLARKGNYPASIELYGRALALNPREASALQGRAVAFEKSGMLQRAEADALSALREDGHRKDSRQLLIRVYRKLGAEDMVARQADALEKTLQQEQAELSRGREMRTALNIAESALTKNDYVSAIPAYEQVVRLMPQFYEAHFALGVCYQQTGESAKALLELAQYLKFQPLSADGHATLGLVLIEQRRDGEAKPELERAIQLNPELTEARKALANILLSMRNYTGAAAALDPVFRGSNVEDPSFYVIAAQSRFHLSEKSQAMQLCEEGLRRFPGNPDLEAMHSLLLEECGKTEACKIKALNALRQSPGSAAYLKLVTSLLIETRPLDSATTDMVNRVRQALPADPGSSYLFAKWAYATNQLNEAREYSRDAAARSGTDRPMEARALTLLAMTFVRLGQTVEADGAFRHALEINRGLPLPDPQMAYSYVEFLDTQSRRAEADKISQAILEWAPVFGPAHLRKALALEKSGMRRQAIEEARLLLRLPGQELPLLRAAHVMLAKAYSADGSEQDAKVHVAWIESH